MTDAKANTFKIIFCGKLQPGHDVTTATPLIASFLKLSPDLVQMYFDGQQRFVRDDLDFMTATRFQRSFAQAGAVCLVIPMQICAACQCRQKKSPRCIRCKKPLQTITPATSSHPLLQEEQLEHEENNEAYQQKSRAIFWLSIGLSIQAGALLVDQVLQHYALDYVWLYFLSVPAFVLGGWYLAPLKGYPRSIALLCLFPLLGLGVLLLLPERQQVQNIERRHQQWAGALMIAISFIAFTQWGVQEDALADFKTHSTTLAAMLKHQQTNDIALLDEELTKFIEHGFDAAKSSSSRPDTARIIVNELFYRLSDFFMCVHYQYYQTEYLTISDVRTMTQPFHDKYFAMMEENIATLDNPYVKGEFRRRLLTTGDEDHIAFGRSIVNTLYQIQTAARFYYRENKRIPTDPIKDFYPPLTSSPYLTSIHITEDGIISMVFNQKYQEAAGKTLTYIIFPVEVPARNRYEKGYTRLETVRVGGDLDDYHLLNNAIFSAWQIKFVEHLYQ